MKEITITTNKLNHLIDPSLHIWGWEIPVYLFLGGLAAGALLIAALAIVYEQKKKLPSAYSQLAIVAPVGLSIGMVALFLDLEYKLHVFRFYTTFQITSPMSWGSWILMLFYPFSIILTLGTLKEGWPKLYKVVAPLPVVKQLIPFCQKNLKQFAYYSIPVATSLGIYTGILLSAFVARPFWNSAIIAPIFLVSGISTALALNLFFSKKPEEQNFLTKMDLIAILFEVILIALLIIGMMTGGTQKAEALGLIMGGAYTTHFWIFFMGIGIMLPLILEIMELKGFKVSHYLTATLVLFGGLIFRFIMVNAGQVSTWVNY
ncbi:MAG: polysulfide reductase NrfD [Bdellovibrionales bacterium]|jgi:protein NrfD|nr:polysulfide reductase NrfD [Bdellovibrionales bacterium]MBT3525536.1 polysulfide reductase NrfD [Bdellovibrionales bacterium]MBT7670306.1 polysulfide reductase NrfD [Bdellovibrionales bacterium]MBT7765860.1 polysulfide reductase NrfD [Bdellovibrionales bacterium]